MELLPAQEIETLAKAKGLTMLAVCKAAGIAPSTYNRWKARKHSISIENYTRIYEVVTAASK